MDSASDRKKELASLGFSESEIQHLIGEWVNGYRKAMQEKSINKGKEPAFPIAELDKGEEE